MAAATGSTEVASASSIGRADVHDDASVACNRSGPRARSQSPVFQAWNVEVVLLSGHPIRIKVDDDASMGQIMNRLEKMVGSKEKCRIERMGRLVLLGAEKIESFDCSYAYTRIMLTKHVRAMYDRDRAVHFQLVLDETLDTAGAEANMDSR